MVSFMIQRALDSMVSLSLGITRLLTFMENFSQSIKSVHRNPSGVYHWILLIHILTQRRPGRSHVIWFSWVWSQANCDHISCFCVSLIEVYVFDHNQSNQIDACLFPNFSYSILKNCFERAISWMSSIKILFSALRKPPVSRLGSH